MCYSNGSVTKPGGPKLASVDKATHGDSVKAKESRDFFNRVGRLGRGNGRNVVICSHCFRMLP